MLSVVTVLSVVSVIVTLFVAVKKSGGQIVLGDEVKNAVVLI